MTPTGVLAAREPAARAQGAVTVPSAASAFGLSPTAVRRLTG